MWYVDGININRIQQTEGPFPSNHFTVMMVEALIGTYVVGWSMKKSVFIYPFLSTMDKDLILML